MPGFFHHRHPPCRQSGSTVTVWELLPSPSSKLISLRDSRRGTWRLRGLSPLYRTRRGETERPLSEFGHDKPIRHRDHKHHPRSQIRHPSLSPLYQTRRGETERPLSESGHDKSIRHPRSQAPAKITNMPSELISVISNLEGGNRAPSSRIRVR